MSFYHFIMTYRGKLIADDQSKLADCIFYDHGFPKQSSSYHDISDYLEMNSPFPGALSVFDALFDEYIMKLNQDS